MSKERRRHERLDTAASITIDGYTVGELCAKDLSQGGIFVRTARPLPTQLVINLVITIPDHDQSIDVRGEVVHSLPGLGMGIRFTEISDEMVQRLDSYLTELAVDQAS